MIILDTNVISAIVRAEPLILNWLDTQPAESVWTTTVSIFEVRTGLSLMPRGKRRSGLEAAFETAIEVHLGGRVLDFDLAAANRGAEIGAKLRAIGHPPEIRDVMIAGIVAARRATLVTRNTRHFEHAGISLISPWEVA